MQTLKINHLAVWVSIVLLHGLGFLWYGFFFQDAWMEMTGVTMEMAESNMSMGPWIANTFAIVVPVYALAWLFTKLNVDSAIKGLLYGLMIAFCFHFLSVLTSDQFEFRPYALSWISGGINMVSLSITGLILGAWRKEDR